MSKKEELIELIEVLGIRKNSVEMRDQVSETILTPMISDIVNELGDDDDAEEIKKEMNAFKDTYLQKISSLDEEIISHVIALYDKHFTEDEIRRIIDFYTSPAGKRIVELAPVFARELMELLIKHSEQVMREMEEEEEEREMMENAPN